MAVNEDLLRQLSSLSEQDRLIVLQFLMDVNSCVQKNHHITELAGLGKDIWKGVEVQEYINKERASWD